MLPVLDDFGLWQPRVPNYPKRDLADSGLAEMVRRRWRFLLTVRNIDDTQKYLELSRQTTSVTDVGRLIRHQEVHQMNPRAVGRSSRSRHRTKMRFVN